MNAIPEIDPSEACQLLDDPRRVLVDVRTRPEWVFAGVPTLSGRADMPYLIEWRSFPEMQVNPDFVSDLLERIDTDQVTEIYFLCRSGARSMEAARAVQEALGAQGKDIRCYNIREGFEGDLDAHGHRGKVNGWKSRQLGWRQT